MTIRLTSRCFVAFVAVLALTTAAAAQPASFGQTLEGAWNVAVVFDQPGLPPCAPAGTVFTATAPGTGTVIAESCYASEGAGYGSWIRTAWNRYATTFIGNSFGPDGTVAGTYKVRARMRLGPADTFNGPFTTEFYDLGGTLLGSVTGTVSGVRIVVQP
jgi:hypothetical protein